MERMSNGASSLFSTLDSSHLPVDLGEIRAVADCLPQLAWSCLPNGYCDYLSRPWVEYTGVPEEEHYGRAWLDAIHPEDREQTRDGWEAFVLGLAPYDVDYRLRRHDGEFLWFKTRGILVRDADGTPVRVFGISTDIDAQKRAEEMYRESRERLEAALAASGTGTFRWDIVTGAVDWDEQLDRLFGLPPGKTVRSLDRFLELVHSDDRSRVIEGCRRCQELGANFEVEFRVIWPDGSIHWLDDHGRTFRDAEGKPAYVTGACVDITERKLADQRFRAFMDHSPTAAWITDVEGRVRYLSRTCARMFRLPDHDLVGATPSDLYPAPFAEEYLRNIRAVVESGNMLEFIERAPRPDGTTGEFLVYKFPLPGEGLVGGVAIDITERLRAEEQLRDADRRKDEFLALLAHELRNPLAPLRNGLQVMRLAGSHGEAANEARAMMERQLGHMVRLIDDLLDVSRISRNKMELRRERVLLADVVATAVETARPAIEAAGHELLVALPPEPVYLDADLTRLAQVLSNLLTNAAKYTEEHGRIWLTATLQASEIAVSVRDTGIGIPADALPKIFDMFSQIDRSMERTRGGLGIGLALVKGLVEMHGGRVVAQSDGEGQGSTFTLMLPREQTRRPERSGSPDGDEVIHRGPSRRILVVDDNRDSAGSMAAMLKILGHDVQTAFDGEAAIATADEFKPAVILMDVGLPKINGYEATRRIREASWAQNATILAVTGWGQEDDRHESRNAGCDGHLVKPVQLEDLLPYILKAADF